MLTHTQSSYKIVYFQVGAVAEGQSGLHPYGDQIALTLNPLIERRRAYVHRRHFTPDALVKKEAYHGLNMNEGPDLNTLISLNDRINIMENLVFIPVFC